MDNYNSQWRGAASIVALVDLMVSIISGILTLRSFIDVEASTEAISSPHTKVPELAKVMGWFILLLVATKVWATVQLFKATESGRDANDAYKCSRSWVVVAILSIVLFFICNLIEGTYVAMTIGLLIQCLFLFIVCRFMQELILSSTGFPCQVKQPQNI